MTLAGEVGMSRRKKKKGESCDWTYDSTDDVWDTECGHKWQFNSDGPKENEVRFCPFCGARLRT